MNIPDRMLKKTSNYVSVMEKSLLPSIKKIKFLVIQFALSEDSSSSAVTLRDEGEMFFILFIRQKYRGIK